MSQSTTSGYSGHLSSCASSVEQIFESSVNLGKPFVVRGFGKDKISTHIRSSIDPVTTSVSSETYMYLWQSHRTASISTTNTEMTDANHENPLATMPAQSSLTVSSLGCSARQLVSDTNSDVNDEVDWDDVDESSVAAEDEDVVFCRIAMTSGLKSSSSSLTNLIRQNSIPRDSTIDDQAAVRKDPVMTTKQYQQHLTKTELVGSLPYHLLWERSVNDKRRNPPLRRYRSYYHAPLVPQAWEDVLDEQVWNYPW